MARHKILPISGYALREILEAGGQVDEDTVAKVNDRWKTILDENYESFMRSSQEYGIRIAPTKPIEVEVVDGRIRAIQGPLNERVNQRLNAISQIVDDAIQQHIGAAREIVSVFAHWMENHSIVRIIGAGRALLAGSLPANRLAHGGASVFIQGDRSPPPNSRLGGGLIAVSASGKTPTVLGDMRHAVNVNHELETLGQERITVVGISSREARDFQSLCTPSCFVGIDPEKYASTIELRALGDIEEYAISELLDALVVAAGKSIFVNFRLGHEDFGPTGPWHQHGMTSSGEQDR